jgi:hypothetical protein
MQSARILLRRSRSALRSVVLWPSGSQSRLKKSTAGSFEHAGSASSLWSAQECRPLDFSNKRDKRLLFRATSSKEERHQGDLSENHDHKHLRQAKSPAVYTEQLNPNG